MKEGDQHAACEYDRKDPGRRRLQGFTIDNTTFEIRFGYESPIEKERGWEPTPIYPDFTKEPKYDSEEYPFVTVYQGVCPHYKPRERVFGEEWCADCEWMEKHEAYIGICRCKERRRKSTEVGENE